jgi:hypothetical protein
MSLRTIPPGYILLPDGSYYKPKKHRDANLPHHHSGQAPVVEPSAVHEPMGKTKAQAHNPARVLVRVTSVRRRLLDEDNLCEKYHVDCCRYAGIIHGDEPDKTRIEVAQRKAAQGEEEHTVVEVFKEE